MAIPAPIPAHDPLTLALLPQAPGVRRAEIWTVSGGADYTGELRPAAIGQDDHFDTDSVTLCPLTSDLDDADILRLNRALVVFLGIASGTQHRTKPATSPASTRLKRDVAGPRDRNSRCFYQLDS